MAGLNSLSGLLGLSGILGPGYERLVLSFDPIGYWPQWEAGGTIANDLAVNVRAPDLVTRDGIYSAVTLGQRGIPNGGTCPLFNGISSVNNVYTPGVASAFNASEGTAHLWCRMSGAGVWTDGIIRYAALFGADLANNFIGLRRTNVNNTLNWLYIAGGVFESINLGGQTTEDWFPMGLTWSVSAGGTGEVRAYMNGLQTGATQVGLGVWVGALAAIRAAIGSVNGAAPLNVWDGLLHHPVLYDRALSPSDMATLGLAA